jgi:FAD/FMN-containing dehydrogenase
VTATATEPLRLFSPFFDPVDLVLCCSAEATVAEINARVAPAGLRFPLVGDPAASLRAHVTAVDYASGAARFGPYVDNILGMNWELPSGTLIRVGERVIKSTTGYDLQRFLLHSDGRYGRARDYVLRLRPLGGATAEAVLHGDEAALEKACALILHSPWLHWLDAVDLVIAADRGAGLEITADCAPGEEACFAEFFRQLGHDSGCTVLSPAAPRRRSLPALSLKTTLSEARTLGSELARDFGGTARVLVVNGVVHYFPVAPAQEIPAKALAALAQRCIALGGHLSGPLAPTPMLSPAEARWAEELEAAWKQL